MRPNGIAIAAIILTVLLAMTVVFALAADLSGWVVATILIAGAIVGLLAVTTARRM